MRLEPWIIHFTTEPSRICIISIENTSKLTLYQTIPTFNDSAFSPFPTMFSTHLKKNFCVSVTFIVSSANALNLDQSINLSSGKGLKYFSFRKMSNVKALYHTMSTFDGPEKDRLLKTLWEKEKMLVTSIFFFSHNVFYASQDKFQLLRNIYFANPLV